MPGPPATVNTIALAVKRGRLPSVLEDAIVMDGVVGALGSLARTLIPPQPFRLMTLWLTSEAYPSAAAESFLFRVEADDPRAFAAALITLSLAALVASAIPARRAASVDPMVALTAQ